jgi:hypothetical protein
MPVIAGPADPQAQIAGVRSAGWSFWPADPQVEISGQSSLP